MSNPNHQIIDALSTIADSYKNTGNVHKYKAYRTAISTIRSFDGKISVASQLKGMKGIGKAMLEKIDEILRTGVLKQEQEVLADPITAALKLFTEVHGIGPKLADKLVHEHGFRSLEDLENASIHLPAQVRLGLKYHNDTQKRIPYDEVKTHYNFIKAFVHEFVDKSLILEVCGSHRRGGSTSGDVDVLVSHPHSHSDGPQCTFLKHIVAGLRKEGYIIDALVEGPSKFMGYCRLPESLAHTSTVVTRRLDLRWIPFDSFYASLLYFTGSDMFNVAMRTEALKKGFTINEYGIFRLPADTATGSPSKLTGKGEPIEVKSEEDIFKTIGMPFVPPRLRSK